MEKFIKIIAYVLGAVCLVFLVQLVTTNKFSSLKSNYSLIGDVANIKNIETQLECLALNIYREAATEPFEGKVGVAQVTLNRVESGKFAKDVCGVVYQKNIVMERVVCQFSWACDQVHRNRPVNREAYTESYEVAKKVLLEGFRLSILNDALYYHAIYVSPSWPHEKIGKIGQHIFYKEKAKNI